MPRLILDSGGVSALSQRRSAVLRLIERLGEARLWPPVVPTSVLVECLHGDDAYDAVTNQFLKSCVIEADFPLRLARRAAALRTAARRGSAVDAIVVACAEPGGTVLTSDPGDLEALASFARGVEIVPV